jgi:Nuclease-related domain
MTTLIVVAVVSLVVGFAAGRYAPYAMQNEGEALVSRVLGSAFASPDYHLMNNLTLPVSDGTTQVDHVLVSRFGIFVIETKNYSSWIVAAPQSSQWTQVLANLKFKFQNPIFQNHKHVMALRALLDFLPAEHVHSVVVFTGSAKFRTARPEGVFEMDRLVPHIREYADVVMSTNRMQFCVGRLENGRMALTRETDVQHRANLQRRFGDQG